jgi:anti-sigma factor RsiW
MSAIGKLLGKLHGLVKCPCSEVHQLLFDYAQGNLDPDTAKKLEKHIGDCPPCLEYVESYRKTIGACRKHCTPAKDIPRELEKKLHDFIAKEL